MQHAAALTSHTPLCLKMAELHLGEEIEYLPESATAKATVDLKTDPTHIDKSASQYDELVKKIESELTCAVCEGRLDDPRVLPCLHTHCKKCVESLVEKSSSEPEKKTSTIACPQCREEYSLPKGGAGELPESPTFFQLVTLLDVLKAEGSGSTPLTCGGGQDGNPASARCLDCDAYLCDSCLELHTEMGVSSASKHTTVTLGEIKESNGKCLHRPRDCAIHKKELKLYCGTCSTVICDDCTKKDHKPHDYVLVSNIQDEARKSLDEILKNLRKFPGEANAKKEKASALMERQKANVAAIHTKVDETIGELIQLLEDRQGEIHGEIDTHAKKEKDAISADIEEAEQVLSRLNSCIGFVNHLLQTAGDLDLVTMAMQTIEHCEKFDHIKTENKQDNISEWEFDEVWQHSDEIAELKVTAKPEVPVKVIEEPYT